MDTTEIETMRIENREDPGRPLKARRTEDGGAEIRLGDMGITDVVIRLTPGETDRLIQFLA